MFSTPVLVLGVCVYISGIDRVLMMSYIASKVAFSIVSTTAAGAYSLVTSNSITKPLKHECE